MELSLKQDSCSSNPGFEPIDLILLYALSYILNNHKIFTNVKYNIKDINLDKNVNLKNLNCPSFSIVYTS